MGIRSSATGTALQLELSEGPASSEWPGLTVVGRVERSASDETVGAVCADRVGAPVEIDYYIIPGTGGHGRARADALLAVARTVGCEIAVYGYNATRNDKFLVMTGTRPALDALEILLPRISLQMERAARSAVSTYASQVHHALPQMSATMQRRVPVTPYFRDFIRGYGFGIAERIRAFRAEAIKAAGEDLVRVLADDQARVEMMFSRDFPGRQPLRKERAGHGSGLAAGTAAGQAAGFGDYYLAVHDLVFAAI